MRGRDVEKDRVKKHYLSLASRTPIIRRLLTMGPLKERVGRVDANGECYVPIGPYCCD